jgi:hypothetical protein
MSPADQSRSSRKISCLLSEMSSTWVGWGYAQRSQSIVPIPESNGAEQFHSNGFMLHGKHEIYPQHYWLFISTESLVFIKLRGGTKRAISAKWAPNHDPPTLKPFTRPLWDAQQLKIYLWVSRCTWRFDLIQSMLVAILITFSGREALVKQGILHQDLNSDSFSAV